MKAIRVHEFGDFGVLQLEDVPDPKPGSGEVLIRNEAVGVNPVDTYVRAGIPPNKPPLPYTPGKDAAGTVESVGESVTDFRPGDRVYTSGALSGAYAAKTLCKETDVFPLPDRINFKQGAAVGTPAGAAWRALFFRGEAQPGETVLIHGATGAVGIAAIQLARAAGLTVIGTASDDAGKKLALEQGAHHVAAHDAVDEIKAFAGGNGIPLIIEMRADTNLGADLSLLAPRGRVVVVGSHGKTEVDPRQAMGAELDIRGMSIQHMTPNEQRSMYTAITAALESGVLNPIIGQELPLAEAARAHAEVEHGEVHGKLVLIPA